MSAELTTQDRAVAVRKTSVGMDQVIELARDPNFDAAKLHSLLDFQERLDKRAREQAFNEALVAAQSEMPRIEANGRIMKKGGAEVQSKYSKYEDIDRVVRPIREKHGFAITYDNPESINGLMKFRACLLHIDGHSKEYAIFLPIDKSEYRSGPQNATSSKTYGKRNLLCDIFDIVSEGSDKDGASVYDPLTEDHLLDLTTMLRDAKATKANVEAFCKIYKVAELKDIPEIAYQDAAARIKRRTT